MIRHLYLAVMAVLCLLFGHFFLHFGVVGVGILLFIIGGSFLGLFAAVVTDPARHPRKEYDHDS